MFERLFHRRLVPILVAAGLTIVLSTTFVAAQVGKPPQPNDRVENATAAGAIPNAQGQASATGQPEDPGAQGKGKPENPGSQGQGEGKPNDPGSQGQGNGKPDDPGAQGQGKGKPENPGSQGKGKGKPENPGAQGKGKDEPATTEVEVQDGEGERNCIGVTVWENHGHYVSCVARGLITVPGVTNAQNHGEMVRNAAQSDVGKANTAANSRGAGRGPR